MLIASDLPLQGTYAIDGRQGTRAVRLVLEERGFRAGRFSVGYVSCDGATPRDDISPAKCRRSARAYVAAKEVVGVIGPFFSSCAIHMMPVLNRAGLAEIGPGNTYVGLTRSGPGIPEGQPERFRPTGRQTFVRLAAPDDLQGRAHAGLARERGERTAYVLHDGVDAYGLGAAEGFRDAARAEGDRGSGLRDLGSGGDGLRRARAARSRAAAPTASSSAAIIVSNAGKLMQDLRAALDEEVTLMATEAHVPDRRCCARAPAPLPKGCL